MKLNNNYYYNSYSNVIYLLILKITMKKIIFTLLITLLLTSCSFGKKTDNVKETTSSGITQSKKELIDANSEKRKQVYLENTSNDVKKVFEDLEKAKKSKDIQKEQELLKEIKKLEDAKRKELDDAVKK
jgi:hypothetical protein